MYVICGQEKDKYSSLTELSWFRLIIKLLHKLVQNRKQGVLRIDKSLVYVAGSGDADFNLIISPKNHKIAFQEARIDENHLQRYRELCGYSQYDTSVPLCYVETLFIKPLIALVSSAKFCLSPLGLIHIRQTVKQTGTLLSVKSKLVLGVEVKQYRQSDRGVEVDIFLQAKNGENGPVVWEGTTTLLSRAGNYKGKPKPNKESRDNYQHTGEVSVASNCGIQFARLTGDWNPHHLCTLSAWLLGYKKPIAHGMWTLARAIAYIEKEQELEFDGRHEVVCEFKRPLYMPSSVFVRYDGTGFGNGRVRVEEKGTGVPHLVAHFKNF